MKKGATFDIPILATKYGDHMQKIVNFRRSVLYSQETYMYTIRIYVEVEMCLVGLVHLVPSLPLYSRLPKPELHFHQPYHTFPRPHLYTEYETKTQRRVKMAIHA